ncbi:hypothetical protein [Acinetobacter sp. Marseille-Q1618]|uniref:hypothetical protein n=1 Tax=Acinetobacter sp. Marseille-Q1618 TaxID=2697502 RepID=UPI0015714F08|nr:hypothetical protein [Acinetobacter sp. Marseille-Q1618]
MYLKSNINVGAQFKLIKHKGDASKPTEETDYFHNLVLDSGLERMSVGSVLGYVSVGSGNSIPNISQTSLDNFIASTNSQNGADAVGNQLVTKPYYSWARRTYRFNAGVAAGNLSEIGVGWTSTNLFNRTLIKDLNGNPTTLTVLNDEFLDVIVEIRAYPQEIITGSFNLLDKLGNIKSNHTISGTCLFISSPSFILGNVLLGAYTDWAGGERMTVFSGDAGTSVTISPQGTVDNTDYSKTTYPTAKSCRNKAILRLDMANMLHKSFVIPVSRLCSPETSQNGYKIQIEPPILKNPNMEIQYTFELSWGRYTP